MKELKDLTINDLLAEGRRWVPLPGDSIDGGFRLEVVFQDHPFRFVLGMLSNDPSLPPPLIVSTDDPRAWCVKWAIDNTIVKNAMDYLSVVASSMEAQRRAMHIRIAADEDIFVLSDGYGNEIRVEEENAMRLYQDLAARLGMPHQINCPQCDEPMMDYEQCSCIQGGV